MQKASAARNFQEADKIKKQLEKRQADMREAKRLQNEIAMAIQKQQFLNAHELQEQLKKAANRALGGGTAGAVTMVMQVGSLMWMRTIMNYQYRYGTSTTVAAKTLYAEGGVLRFYRGLGPALIQGPLSRFGDTAANVGALALLDSMESTANLPITVKTLAASASAATFRIFLTPVDTVKTIMQVEGKEGMSKLMAKAKKSGPTVFYHGSVGAAVATFAGHYPWWATYNTLDANLPVYNDTLMKLTRNAGLGFTSSVVSDTVSNSLRVLKTYRQTSETPVSYMQAAKNVIEQDGVVGLFGRGLKTRILTNGAQATMFSVLWKFFDEKFNKKK